MRRALRSGGAAPLVVLLVVAAVFKVAYAISYARSNPFARFPVADAAVYAEWARAIVTEGWLGNEVFYRAPLYPYLLAAVRSIAGEATQWMWVFQVLAGLGIVGLAWRIAASVFGERAGLFAGIFVLGYAPFTFLETKLLPTVSETFLALAATSMLVDAERTNRVGPWLGGAALLGLALLSRPTYALAIPLLLVLTALRLRAHPRLLAVAAGSLVLLPSLFVGAVALRNRVVGGDLVLVSANGGVTFAQGNQEKARGSLAVLPGFSGAVEEQQREETSIAEAALGRALAPSEVSAYWYRQGFSFIRRQPARYLRLLVDKLALIANNRELGSNYLLGIDATISPVLRLAFIPFGLILALAVPGVYACVRERLPGSAVLAMFGGAIAMMLLFYVSTRYRMALAPAAAVLAGGGVDRILARRRERRTPPSVLAAAAAVLLLSLPPFLPFEESEVRRGDADYWGNLAVAYHSAGRFERAIEAYDRAIALDPGSFRHHQQKTLALRDGGAPAAEVVRWIATVARSFPREPTAQLAWATALEATGRPREAIEAYRRSIALSPDVARAYLRLGALYCATGDPARARETFAEGARRLPEDPALRAAAAAPCVTRPAVKGEP